MYIQVKLFLVQIDQGMDGEAICLALGTTTGPDCLRDVISKYGLRLKVYKAIKETLTQQVTK